MSDKDPILECLEEIEQHCPCGARPESPDTHPHVLGCPVERALILVRTTPHQSGILIPQHPPSDLLARVKELELSLQQKSRLVSNQGIEIMDLLDQLHQRDTALVKATEALLTVRNKVLFKEGADAVEHALSQIQAVKP